MIEKKVKVFNAYTATNRNEDYGMTDIFDFHNIILNKKGYVANKFKPDERDIDEKIKYELDDEEKMTLSMLKHSAEEAHKLYDSCKRKEEKYKSMILGKINKQLYNGEAWDCAFSPIGKCVYEFDEGGGEYVCAFCGEPEERK